MLISEGRPNINEVMLLCSHEFISKFMQHAGMFEAEKVLLMPALWGRAVDDFGDSNIDAIGRAITASNKHYDLVAACTDRYCWLNPRVKSVSDGEHWWLLTKEYVQARFRSLRFKQDEKYRLQREQALGR